MRVSSEVRKDGFLATVLVGYVAAVVTIIFRIENIVLSAVNRQVFHIEIYSDAGFLICAIGVNGIVTVLVDFKVEYTDVFITLLAVSEGKIVIVNTHTADGITVNNDYYSLTGGKANRYEV